MENCWKALQNHDMLVAQKFVENVYYHELARDLRRFGYVVENKPRGDFEIRGISAAVIEKFSKPASGDRPEDPRVVGTPTGKGQREHCGDSRSHRPQRARP